MVFRSPLYWLYLSLVVFLLSACGSDSSDPELSSLLLQFEDSGPVYLKIGDVRSNPVEGSKEVSYQSSNENVAIVDADGDVTVLALGRAIITATKSANENFKESTASYQLIVTFSVNAWIGEQNTQLGFSEGTEGLEFYRSTDFDCDFTNYGACELGLMDVLAGNAVIDTAATLNQKAIYLFSQNNQSSNFRTSFPLENLPGRRGHQVVSFKDRLWLMGGTDFESPYIPKSDLWSSQDAIHWTQEVESLPFGSLQNYKVIAFQNKLWVIGGYTSWENREDSKSIWSSVDGINWVEETGEAPFGAHYSNFQMTVFKQKLWLMDKKDETTDIWSSEDGVTWSSHSSELNTFPHFDQAVTAFNNKLWSLGDSGPNTREEIWSSSNGFDWKKHTLAQPLNFQSSFGKFNIDVIKNKLLIFDRFYSWSSDDGVNWIEERGGFEDRNGVPDWSATVLYRDQLWVIGAYEYRYQNEAWTSSDGINWKQRKEDKSILSRTGFQVAEFNGKLWLTGGYGSEDLESISGFEYHKLNNNDTWSSVDGLNWEKEISDTTFSSRFNHQMFLFKNKLWLLGGNYYSESGAYEDRNDIWSSADGINWIEEVKEMPFSNNNRYMVTEFNGKLWLIDGYNSNSNINDIWSSDDGVNWNLEVEGADFTAHMSQVTVFKNRMWAMGGGAESDDEGGYVLKDLWSSSDGVHWEEELANAPNINIIRDEFYLLALKDNLLIISGELLTQEKARVISSSNGTDWREEIISESVNFSTWDGVSTKFNDEIWVSGGYILFGTSRSSGTMIAPEPWKSEDGVNWRKGIRADVSLSNFN